MEERTNQYPNSEQQLPHWLPMQVALALLGSHMAFVDTFEEGDGLVEVLVLDEVLVLVVEVLVLVVEVLVLVVDEVVLLL